MNNFKRVLTIAFSCFVLTHVAYAQPNKRQKGRSGSYRDPFLNTQWWIGIKAGANLTKAKPTDRYSTFNSTVDPSTNEYDKKYQNFNKLGGQAGIEITFYRQGFSLSFQPNYRRMSFVYTNEYNWQDASNATYSFSSHYKAIQKLDYFELPLLGRYEPFKTRLRPFVQVGVFYAILNNAYKATEIKVTDNASGSVNEYTDQNITVGAKDLFIKTNLGWIVGAGFSYPVGNVRLALDISYRRTTNNITSAANRFSNDRLTGSGDVMDDLKLRNLSASVSILIPLRFIMKGSFKAE
ncbi:MAG TPA: outer membrane beta-barrel protein [Cytophagaceae bacterium]|nr:outer membrane beta-barrel protein [Cytophagaceae bacterium]